MAFIILVIVLSGALTAAGLVRLKTADRLIDNGKKAEAVVLDNTRHEKVFYPTVKFLTDKNEWITRRLPIATMYRIEQGAKVIVIYHPEDLSAVEIFSAFRLIVVPRLLLVAGVMGLTFSLLEMLGVTNIIL